MKVRPLLQEIARAYPNPPALGEGQGAGRTF